MEKVKDWRISITQEHIDAAEQSCPSRCMIAIALRDMGAWSVDINSSVIRFNYDGVRYIYPTPKIAIEWLITFDQNRNKAKPFALRLRGSTGTMGPVIVRGPHKYKARRLVSTTITRRKKGPSPRVRIKMKNRRYRQLLGSKVMEIRQNPALP